MSERIGIVTGGGDCPGLNAVIRAVAKAAAKRGWETIGFLGGYEGILEPQRYVNLGGGGGRGGREEGDRGGVGGAGFVPRQGRWGSVWRLGRFRDRVDRRGPEGA